MSFYFFLLLVSIGSPVFAENTTYSIPEWRILGYCGPCRYCLTLQGYESPFFCIGTERDIPCYIRLQSFRNMADDCIVDDERGSNVTEESTTSESVMTSTESVVSSTEDLVVNCSSRVEIESATQIVETSVQCSDGVLIAFLLVLCSFQFVILVLFAIQFRFLYLRLGVQQSVQSSGSSVTQE